MRCAARDRMIHRIKRDSTVLLKQTVWRQTEVCISISTVGRLGVDKIKTLFRETGCQEVCWVEPVEACDHRDEHFYFYCSFCVLWNCSALLQITHLYITLRLVMTYLNVIAGIQTHHRPFLVLSPHACRHPVPLYWQPCTWLPTIVAWHTCVITVTTHDVSKRKFLWPKSNKTTVLKVTKLSSGNEIIGDYLRRKSRQQRMQYYLENLKWINLLCSWKNIIKNVFEEKNVNVWPGLKWHSTSSRKGLYKCCDGRSICITTDLLRSLVTVSCLRNLLVPIMKFLFGHFSYIFPCYSYNVQQSKSGIIT